MILCRHSAASVTFQLPSVRSVTSVPSMALNSNVSSEVIEQLYCDVFACISKATVDCIPSKQHSPNDFNVPGWNTHVSEKYDAAR